MDEDNKMTEPGPSIGCSSDRGGVPVCTTHHRDIIPPSRPRDEGSDSEYGVRRSISCEQLAAWNSQLFEKNYVICPLPNCGLMFHGAPQIQNHYVNCTGRYDGAVLKCVHCQAVVAADHMYQHMKAMHHSEPSPHLSSDSGSSEVARVTGIIEGGGRSNQKSGRFLLGSVAVPSGASGVVSEDEDGRDFHRYSIYGISKACPSTSTCNQEQLERQWSQDIANSGCATCPIEGCHLKFPSINSISLHFQHCCRSPKSHEYVVCEMCNKKFASVPMLDDHIYHIHEESRQKIRIRNLDNSVTDCSLRRCIMGGRDEVERRRVTDAPQIFHPLPMEEDVNHQSDSDHQCKQREVFVRSAASESDSSLVDCYLPHHGSRSQYHLTKNQGHSRESVNAGPSTYNSPTVLHSYHSTSKQSRHVEYEKHKMHEDVSVFGNTSAFHRVRDRSGSEHLITVPFGTESKEPSRFLYEGSNSLFGKDDGRERLTSGSPCCRPLGQSVRTSFMRKSGTGSPVYPTTSGVKRKYVEKHSYGNIYESHKSRKCGPKVSYSTGYTSDESEEDGRPIQNREPRIRHSPGMRPHARSCIKADTYPPAGRSVRRGQTPPFPGHSEKESLPVFERHSLPDESYFDPNGMMPTVTGCMWEEEEEGLFTAPVHIKKRQLAERAQQLQRAEEAVKQQEEEAQERTWRALHEQEMALREKEEALKQREAVAQKKIEEATRLIEESRKLGDSKKFKDEKSFLNTRPVNLQSTNKRSSSSGPFHNCQELGNQLGTSDVHDDIAKCTDSSVELGGTSSLVTNELGTTMIPSTSHIEVPLKMGRISNESFMTKVALANTMLQRQGENHSVISSSTERTSSLQNVNETSTQRENNIVEMLTQPKCNLDGKSGSSKDRNVNLWELNETIPRIEPSKVIRTYSRANRCRTVKESSETLALSYIQTKACIPPRAHSVAPVTKTSMPTVSVMTSPEISGETVINEGATVTITTLTTAERPPRPCSAMPNLQPSGFGGSSDPYMIPRSHPSPSSVSKLALPVTVTVMLESHHKPSSSLMQTDASSKAIESSCHLSMQPITPLHITQPKKTLVNRNTLKKLPASASLQEVTQNLQQVKPKQNIVKYSEKAKPCTAVSNASKGRKLSMKTLECISISGHEKKNQFADAVDESTVLVMKCDKSPTEVGISSQNTSPSPCPMYVMCNSQENAASTTRYKNWNLMSGTSHQTLFHLSTTTKKKFPDVNELGIQEPSEETVKVKSCLSNPPTEEYIKNVTGRPLFQSFQNRQDGTLLLSHNISPVPFSASLSYREASKRESLSFPQHLSPEPQQVSLSPCLVSAASHRALPSSSHSSLISQSLLLAKPTAKSASPSPHPAKPTAKSTSTSHPAKPTGKSVSPTPHPGMSTTKSASPTPNPELLTPHSSSSQRSPTPHSASLTSYPMSSVLQPELLVSLPESPAAQRASSSSDLTSSTPYRISPAPPTPHPTSPTPNPKSSHPEALSSPHPLSLMLNQATPRLCPTQILHPASPVQHSASLTSHAASPVQHLASLTSHPASPMPRQVSPTPLSALLTTHPTSPTHHSVLSTSHPTSPVLHPAIMTPHLRSLTSTPGSLIPYSTSIEAQPASPVSNSTPTPHPESLALHPALLAPHSGSPTSNPPSLILHQTSPTCHPASPTPRSELSVSHPASLLSDPVDPVPHSTSPVPHPASPAPHQSLSTPDQASQAPSAPYPTSQPPNSTSPLPHPASPIHHSVSPTLHSVSLASHPASPTCNSASPSLHPTSPTHHPASPATHPSSPASYPTSPVLDLTLPRSFASSAPHPASPVPHLTSVTSHHASLSPHPSSSPPHLTSHPPSPASHPPSPASLPPSPTSHPPSPVSYPPSPVSYPPSPTSYPPSPTSHPPSPTSHLSTPLPYPPSPTRASSLTPYPASLSPHPVSSVTHSASLLCHPAVMPLPHSRASSTPLSPSSSHPESPTLHRSLPTSHPPAPVPYQSPLTHPVSPKPHVTLTVANSASLPTSPVYYPPSVTHQQVSVTSYQETITPHLLPTTPLQISSTPCPLSLCAGRQALPICLPTSSLASYQVSSTPHLTSAPYHETLPPPLLQGTSPISHPAMAAESHQSSFVPLQILTASVDSQEPEKQVAVLSDCEVSVPSVISSVSCPDILTSNETQPKSQQLKEIHVHQQSAVILQDITQSPQSSAQLTRAHSHQEVIQSSHEESQVTSQETVMVQEVMHLSQQGSQMADQLPSNATNFGLNGTELAEPQILGEYDPLTGTFTSNNPAFLQSILNNSLNFPTRCLTDNNSSNSVTGSLTSHPSSVSPVRHVSVQIQTEDFPESGDKLEVLSFPQKSQDNNNYNDENGSAENMPHHLIEKKEHHVMHNSDVKQQFTNIKDENVEYRHHTARANAALESSDPFGTESESLGLISAKTERSSSVDSEYQSTHGQENCDVEETYESAVLEENYSDSEEAHSDFQMRADEIDHETENKNATITKNNYISSEVTNAEVNHENMRRKEVVDRPVERIAEEKTSDLWKDDNSLKKASAIETNNRKVITENASGLQWMNQTVRNEAATDAFNENVSINVRVFDEKKRVMDTKIDYGPLSKEMESGSINNESVKERHLSETYLKNDVELSSNAKEAIMLTKAGVKTYSNMVPGILNQNISLQLERQMEESEIVLHADRKKGVTVHCTSEVNLNENQEDLLNSEMGKITGKNKIIKLEYNKINYGSEEMQKDNVQECQAAGYSNDRSHEEDKADMVSGLEHAVTSAECFDLQKYEKIKVTSRGTGREGDKVRGRVRGRGRGKRSKLDTGITSAHGKSESLEPNHDIEKVCSFRINHDVKMLDTSLIGKMGITDKTAEGLVQSISSQENCDLGYRFQDKSSSQKEGEMSVSTADCPLSLTVGECTAENSESFEKCSKNVKKNVERHYVKRAIKVEKPEVEEKVERVSRGGRKLKLKDWWTGVVTDATSSRSKTCSGSKTPIRSSIKSVKYKDFSAKLSGSKKDLTESNDISEGLKTKEKLGYVVCQPTNLKRDDNLWYSGEITGDSHASMPVDELDTTSVSLPPILDETQKTVMAVEGEILPTTCDVKPARKRKGRPRASHPKDQVDSELSCLPEEEVKCGNCGFLCVSQGHFVSHAQLEHNGLARPDGENQEFTEDEVKFILNNTIKAVKRLKCMKCFNVFRSLLGYRRHILACGINSEELNVTCKICNKQVRYYYFDLHMKKNHCERQESKKIEKQDESRKNDDQTISGPRPRRKAAANCNARLQVWRSNKTGECGSDVSDGEDDYHKELNLSQFYSKPEPTIPEEYSKKWEADLAFHGKAVCINEGCAYTFTEVARGHTHIWNCPLSTTDKTFSCRICEFTSLKEDEIVNHIALNHTDVIAGSFEGSDYDISDDDYESPRKVYRNYGSVAGLQLKPFPSALTWTLEFLNGTISERLFSEFYVLRDNWNALDDQVARKYLPSIRYSPKFRIQMVTNEENKSGEEWQELDQLNGIAQEKGYAMFCGGPVTASAWCPQPLSFSNSVQQYLAISSVSSPEKKYHVNKSAHHDGLIQIWDCSCLGENSKEPPKFLFGIAHDYGNVWSLVWCPSGTFEFNDDSTSQENDTLSRLGLLAAACSDGTVRIFAIPQPSNLDLLDSSKIYKALPKITLSPGEMYKDEAQCLKVDWCRAKGHGFVAGALSTGVVCVWDVNCTSLLLRVEDIQGNFTLYPVNSFLAHNGVCSVVAFCPTTGGRNLLSGGSDRTYKFWDLENTDMPLSITRKGLVLDAVWLPHWAGCFISFDDVYGLTNTNTCFRENGFFGIQSRNVLSSNAPVWSLAGSDWLNAVIQGDSAGEVMITVQQQLFRNYENDKFPSKRKVPLLSVRMQNFSNTSPVSFRVCLDSKQLGTSETPKTKASKKHKKSRQGQGEKESVEEDGLCPAAFVEWPRTYFETCQNYGIVFFDQDCENFSQIPDVELTERKRSDYMEPGPVACYPMMAATSIAWNNNISAPTWIFVGTHSGLGRLLNVKALSIPEEEKCKDNLINAENTLLITEH